MQSNGFYAATKTDEGVQAIYFDEGSFRTQQKRAAAVGRDGGGELTIAAMDEYSRTEIGRKTYRFVRRCMRDPELRAKNQTRAAELRAEAEGR